jgi:lysophospholipase L1-like esterase
MHRIRAAAAVFTLAAAACGAAASASRAMPGSAHPGAIGVAAAARAGGGVAGGPRHHEVDIPVAGSPPVAGVPWFLTIGDSITFGYTRDRRLSGTNISWAPKLAARLAAQGRPWSLYDTACPGETTVTYATRCPEREEVPFLEHRSQRDAAMTAIAAHGADLRLIVVALGSNDLLQSLGAADTTAVVSALTDHLTTIVDDLRGAAPGVPMVLAAFYDPFAISAPQSDVVLGGMDADIAALADRLGIGYADVHTAINHAPDGTPLCRLIDCADLDIHPTALGQERLADAVLAAVPPPAPG